MWHLLPRACRFAGLSALVALLGMFAAAEAEAAGGYEDPASPFPPGGFSDGHQYQLSDFEGKVLVLLFFESHCPNAASRMRTYNKKIKQFKDQPVKFIAVGASDNKRAVESYIASNKLDIPVFVDSYGVMENRYGLNISMQNVLQARSIGPDGEVDSLGYEPSNVLPGVEKVVSTVEWTYPPEDYHAQLKPVIQRLEWKRYKSAMRLLGRAKRMRDEKLVASAEKLQAAVLKNAQASFDAAKGKAVSEPIGAYDKIKKLARGFARQDVGKHARKQLAKLKQNQAVKHELAARKMYGQLESAMIRADGEKPNTFARAAMQIAKRYPDTPTSTRAESLARELAK